MRISDWSSDVCSSDLREMFVASDLAAIVRHTTTVAHLDDGEIASVTATGFTTYRQDLTTTAKSATVVDVDPSSYDAGEHRSEERRVGKEGVSTCRSRGSPYH